MKGYSKPEIKINEEILFESVLAGGNFSGDVNIIKSTLKDKKTGVTTDKNETGNSNDIK